MSDEELHYKVKVMYNVIIICSIQQPLEGGVFLLSAGQVGHYNTFSEQSDASWST